MSGGLGRQGRAHAHRAYSGLDTAGSCRLACGVAGGPILGKMNKGGRFEWQGTTASSIYAVVLRYAARLGLTFQAHDLRRTYGKLAHKGGARIEQIQLSYGHASLTTTERYLGIDRDLEDAPCDHLGLKQKR